MDHAALKKQLRRKHKAIRKGFSAEERRAHSEAMLKHLQNSNLTEGIRQLHLFLSIDRFAEPDTFLILNWMRERHPRISLSVPLVQESSPDLIHILLTSESRIEVSDWGIPEPVPPFQFIAPEAIDLVLVPLLAFDSQGNRLGYGKGMYDRFLSGVRPDCKKIGISYAENHEKEGLPAEDFDVPLDGILTQKGLIWIR